MLESQERAFNSALDIVVKQLNDQINKLENRVVDLTTSLEFTQKEVDDLKSQAKDYAKERNETMARINHLHEEVEASNKKNKELEDRINHQEDYSRRKNIRISGMEEMGGNETWEQTAAAVKTLLEDKMQLSDLVLERAHRVGLRREGKPRPIVARFLRYADRDAVMRNGKKLKGTNIFVNEDLCAASQAIKSSQFPLLKQARAQGKIAFFRHTKLIIREKNDDNTARRMQPSVGEGGGAVGGAMGDSRDGAAGPAAAAAGADGDVIGTEVAGVWSSGGGGEAVFPSLPVAHPSGARPHSPAAPAAASFQCKIIKKSLRSSSKK